MRQRRGVVADERLPDAALGEQVGFGLGESTLIVRITLIRRGGGVIHHPVELLGVLTDEQAIGQTADDGNK